MFTAEMNEQFEACLQVFFKLYPTQAKYKSDANCKLILARMRSYGLATSSETMVRRAIQELVAEKKLHRADGGSEATDKAAAAAAQSQRLEQIAASPITKTEYEHFLGLSPKELAEKYWGTDASAAAFRVRYDKSVREHGFRVPPKPASTQGAEANAGKFSNLTAKEYYLMPVAEVVRNYKSDPSFKAAVDKLISEGKI